MNRLSATLFLLACVGCYSHHGIDSGRDAGEARDAGRPDGGRERDGGVDRDGGLDRDGDVVRDAGRGRDAGWRVDAGSWTPEPGEVTCCRVTGPFRVWDYSPYPQLVAWNEGWLLPAWGTDGRRAFVLLDSEGAVLEERSHEREYVLQLLDASRGLLAIEWRWEGVGDRNASIVLFDGDLTVRAESPLVPVEAATGAPFGDGWLVHGRRDVGEPLVTQLDANGRPVRRERLPGSASDPVGIHAVNGRWVAVESRGLRANPRIRIFDETLESRVVFEPDETTVEPVPWWGSAALGETVLVFRQSARLSVRRFDVSSERWLGDWQDLAEGRPETQITAAASEAFGMVGTCGRDRVVVTNREGELLATEDLPLGDHRTVCDIAFSNTEPAFGVVWVGPVTFFSKYLLESVD